MSASFVSRHIPYKDSVLLNIPFYAKTSIMRKKKSITLSSKPTYQGYSHGFKIAIIESIENGQLSIRQAAKEYDDIHNVTFLMKNLVREKTKPIFVKNENA